MSDAMKIAIQFTAINMLDAVVKRVRDRVLSLGDAGGKVKKDFDDMNRHITAGLKSVAVSAYALNKLKPGVATAGDLQEAMIDVKLNLMESGKSAKALDDELAKVRATAIDVSKVAPFSAQEVVGIENTFLKAGLSLNDVTAKGGAAWAATALATISKEAPATIADAMVTMATPFNIKGGQFGDLADWIQKVDAASVTTVPELMEGMKYVAGTAAVMKVSWQDTIRALGVVSQSGLRGSMGGTSLNDFLVRLNGTSRETRRIMIELNHFLAAKGGGKLEFFDKAGKLKGLPAIIADLRKAMTKLNDRQQMFVMEKIFGEQGARAALALIKQGEGSWENIGENIGKAASLQDKMNERLTGFNANMKALSGTSKTTIATLFDPLLSPLARVVSMLNDVVAKIGQVAEKSPALASAVSYGTAGIAASAGAYGLYRLLRGGVSGGRVLKGIGGLAGLLGGKALGIAEGKAVEAATGVTPVFVTNWPSGGIPGVPGGGDILKKTGGRSMPFLRWMVSGSGAVTTAAVGAALAGMGTAGYAAMDVLRGGTGKNWISESPVWNGWYGEKIYELLNARQKEKPEVKNNINLSIKIDKDGRVLAVSDDLFTNTEVNLDRGSFALQ